MPQAAFSKSSTNIFKPRLKRQSVRLYRRIIFPLSLLLFTITAFVLYRYLFYLTRLECQSGSSSCPGFVLQAASLQINKSYFSLDSVSLTETIMQLTGASDVNLSLKLPGTLEINYPQPKTQTYINLCLCPEIINLKNQTGELQLPLANQFTAFLASQSASVYALLDSGQLDPSDQPSNYYLLSPTYPDPKALILLKNLLSQVEAYLPAGSSLFIFQDLILIKTPSWPEVLISSKKSADQTMSTLQFLNSLVTIRDRVNLIDLRFDQAIIK
ncbi:hypothetical protein HY333_00810 [Candidatus Collierbacteria bacterium]|nr:hypothetical protein [Candidatus Collierbacteria bacterium]